MTDSILDCIVCQEPFSDIRQPRNLNCGHSLCTKCAEIIIKNSRFCPECRAGITVNKVTELPVNYPLLRLATSLPAKNTHTGKRDARLNSVHGSAEAIPSAPVVHDVQTEDHCRVHGSLVSFMCTTCKVWICKDCMESDHLDPPRGNCRITSFRSALEDMKKSHKMSISLSRYPKQMDKIRKIIDKEKVILTAREGFYKTKLQELQSQIKAMEDSLIEIQPEKKKLVARMSKLSEITDMMEHSKALVEQASSVKELETAIETVAERLEVWRNFKIQEKARLPAVQKTLLRGSKNLLEQLQSGMSVSVIADVNGKRRWSQVIYKDNQILLYCLRPGSTPKTDIVLPFDCLREMVPENTPSIFLEVSWGDNLRGRVFVRMLGNKPRHLQALILCSGEQGPSYRNTLFYCYMSKYSGLYNVLTGGDYLNNDGTGAPAVVQGITDGGIYRHQIIAGLMVGFPMKDPNRLGGFHFHLKDVPDTFDMAAIGIVTTGLDTLQMVAKMKENFEVTISECGLAIPVDF